MLQYFSYDQPFVTERGGRLPSLQIAYHTYGRLNDRRDNVVWVCHALTANADVADWWPGMTGAAAPVDTDRYFVICANIIGSCYGSTGPLEINPEQEHAYYHDFPALTIRDMVQAHILLRKHLGIAQIHLLMGGSMGGYQALEWACMEAEVICNLFLIATAAAESAWGIAIHTAQRLAIEADASWEEHSTLAGHKGLKAARAIGMLSYRNYQMFEQQRDPDRDKTDDFKVSAYIHYQGDKLVRRFNAYSYWILSKAMDSHNLARGRNRSLPELLTSLPQRVLLISISSDQLCPPQEQRFMAEYLQQVSYHEMDSDYGHDGFLTETARIGALLRGWMETLPA
jgi:homoserine O-acetyltransferase/O-succinyltransferase